MWGSASLLVNSSNNPVAGSRTWYLPFGGYWPGSAPTQTITDRDFTGQRENMELGLLYYGARFYVPGLGRFASADTIIPNPANPQSYNRYSYVLNSPLNFTDPTGHIETPFDQTGGGGPVAGDDERTDGTGTRRLEGSPTGSGHIEQRPGTGTTQSAPNRTYVNNNSRATVDEIRVGEFLDTQAQSGNLPGVSRVEGAAETVGARSGDYRLVRPDGVQTSADLYQPTTADPSKIWGHIVDKSGQAETVVVEFGEVQSGITQLEAQALGESVINQPGVSIVRVIIIRAGEILVDVFR